VFILFLLLSTFISLTFSSEGKVTSPYEACKDVVIVSREKYLKNKSHWDQYEQSCSTKIQLSDEAGFTSLDPLKEGVQYLEFSQRVAEKVIENLEKSRKYAECSASCFSGAKTCSNEDSNKNKIIQCDQRKKEIQNSMKVYSRKIRMELALSQDAPGLINVNVANVINSDKSKLINTNLRDFEAAMPNPLGRMNLTEREEKEALRRVSYERKQLEQEFVDKKIKNYNEWMSVRLMQNFDKHKDNYRSLIYEEAPIFGVIERPKTFEEGSEPVWDDAQIVNAFKKLSDNSKITQQKVNASLEKSKLEFSRYNGEALGKWMASLMSPEKEQNDLLFYIGMKNQVEEVLKNDPSSCAIATSMQARLHSKELQNAGVTFSATLFSSGLLKGASSLTSNVFRIGRALSGAEAAGLTGMALGATSLGESFSRYNSGLVEVATKSGLDKDQEGSAIRAAEDISSARDGVVMAFAFAPLDAIGGWSVGKTLYGSLYKHMVRDIPEMSNLVKTNKITPSVRDQLVDKWLVKKVQAAFKAGNLSGADKAAIESKEAKDALVALTNEIEKANADFFKNPKNIDFYLKTAATIVRKDRNDLSDLGGKTKHLLLHFNTEALDGSWNPNAQSGLLKVFDNAIEELRLSAKNDPATYAKFTTDPKSQEKIILNALRKSGAKEEDTKEMLRCALPILKKN